ncbi:hypothetical protein FGO68_gene11253 [Halteria grandinella]|uniref:MORN repeat protein n=1 Tax=Halteria grandinella TaxID=5974 RepID=A0A8J8NCU6_HALGN|nr:hypothetical protein FGO68_gene11253 [Halteria grandinella]
MLDKLISTFNKPFDDYEPELNADGDSKLTECIKKWGWKWSLNQLNQHARPDSKVQWTTFEGAERKIWNNLQQGVYYGQMQNEKRHGFGIVYTTDSGSNPWLYECEWKEGSPINEGRYIWIVGNEWYKFEGTIDDSYYLNGHGSQHNEDGYQYQGQWKQGDKHGQGKVIYKDGRSYEGEWQDNYRHGQGRKTDKDGTYHEGQWKINGIFSKEVGVHKYYNKEGKLIETKDHGDVVSDSDGE